MPDMPKELIELHIRQRLEHWATKLDNENATPSVLIGQALDDMGRVIVQIRPTLSIGELRRLLLYCLDEIKDLADDAGSAAPDAGGIPYGQDGPAATHPADL